MRFQQQVVAQFVEINILDDLQYCLGAHAGLEDICVFVLQVVVLILGENVLDMDFLELLDVIGDFFFQLDSGFNKLLTEAVYLFDAGLVLFRLGYLFFEAVLAFGDILLRLFLQLFDGFLAGFFVDRIDDVLGEVEHVLEVTRRKIQQQAETAGDTLGEPDMAHRAGQPDVTHTLAANLGAGNLNAAFITDDTLVADSLVFAAVAFEIFGGAENSFAKKAVAFRLESSVVNRLRLGYVAVRPAPNLFR